MGYTNNISNSDRQRLCRLKREIYEFHKVSYSYKEVCASDIYDFIKNRAALRGEFPSGKKFSQFLRRMHHLGVLKQFISYNVDVTIYHYYKWRFYCKTQNSPDEVLATSEKGKFKYFKNQLSNVTNDNGNVRSKEELYIFNRLLNEKDLHVKYEEKTKGKKGWKLTDFVIKNKVTRKKYYWEHAGMAANHEYALKTSDTAAWYIENGNKFIEEGGAFIMTYYKNEHSFHNDVERIINLIKNPVLLL